MGFYLGIDLGTSYFKAGIFDEQGNLVGLGRCCVDKQVDDGGFADWQSLIFGIHFTNP